MAFKAPKIVQILISLLFEPPPKRKPIQGQKYNLPYITATILQGLASITKYDVFVLVTTVLS